MPTDSSPSSPARPAVSFRTVLALAVAVLTGVTALGCAASGQMSDVVSVKQDGFEQTVDSVYVTVDFTSRLRSYAGKLAVAFDSSLSERNVRTHVNPRGHELVSEIPGIDAARESGYPYILVLSQSASTGQMTFSMGSASDVGDLSGTVYDASLYATGSRDRLWRGQFDLDGNVAPGTVARRLCNQLQRDGLLPPV